MKLESYSVRVNNKSEPIRAHIINAEGGEIRLSPFPNKSCAEIEDMWQATLEHIEDRNYKSAHYFCERTIKKLRKLSESLGSRR